MSNYEDEIFSEPLDLPEEHSATPQSESSLHARTSKTKKPLLYALIALAAMALIAGGFFGMRMLLSQDQEATETPAAIQENEGTDVSEQNQANEAVAATIPTEYELQTIRTATPRLEVTFPDTWELEEREGGVTIRSPRFSFPGSAGDVIEQGYFKVYMRQGARSEDSVYFGAGVASEPSEPLEYSDPALGQREQTSVSFFGPGVTSATSYFLVSGNFSLEPGATLGPDFASEPEDYIIVGGYSSGERMDDLEMDPVPTTFFDDTEAYRQALDIIRTLKIL